MERYAQNKKYFVISIEYILNFNKNQTYCQHPSNYHLLCKNMIKIESLRKPLPTNSFDRPAKSQQIQREKRVHQCNATDYLNKTTKNVIN